ncbi:MAG: YaeQ family protein [Planctomycetota bacterium]|jgi:uncharacterized protein YaeQ
MRDVVHTLELELADETRKLWRSLSLRVARHPSESIEMFHTRLLTWALFWSEGLTLRQGVCRGNEPALWEEDLTGRMALWIDVGLPDMDRLRHAISRAEEVVLVACPADERALAAWRGKHWKGQRFPRFILPPRDVVLGLEDWLDRRLEWYLHREADEISISSEHGQLTGRIVDVGLS